MTTKKLYKVFFSICMYVGTLNFALAQEYEINADLDQANTMLKNHQYQEATSYLEEFVKSNPNNYKAFYTLGESYKALNNKDKAMECFQKAYSVSKNTYPETQDTAEATTFNKTEPPEQNTDYANDYIDMGDMYYSKNDYENAIYYYESALKLLPENETLISKLAELYYQTKNYEKSDFYRLTLNKINKTNVFDAKYYNKKGIEYYQVADFEHSKIYFNKAISIDNKYFEAYNNLANVELKLGNDKEAVKLYQKSLQLNKKYTDAMLNMANASKDDINQKLKYVNKAIKTDPDNYRAYFERGLVYYKQKKTDLALQDFLASAKYNPQFFEANYDIALLYASVDKLQESAKYLQAALSSNPDSSIANYFMAKIYRSMERPDIAAEYLESAIKNDPQNYKYYYEMAQIYLKLNNIEKAQESAQAASSLGNDADSYNLLGLILYKNQSYYSAADSFEKAIEINSKRPIFHYNLSQCYKTTGEKSASQREYQTAISMQPESPESYIDLIHIYQDRQLYIYAQNTMEKAIEAYPKNKSFYQMLSEAYKSSGNLEASEGLMRKYKVNMAN